MEGLEKDASSLKREPQQRRALDRIDAILAATEAEVAEGGYDNLTMVNIAARAGITHTSIYHYFKSVEPILEILISRRMAEFDRGVAATLAGAVTVDDLVTAALKSIELGFVIYRSHPVMRGLWVATRYQPALRKIDDDNVVQTARLFSDRFLALQPGLDRNRVYTMMIMTGALTVPAYEAALALPKRQQKSAINDFLEMVRARLSSIVAPM